MNNQRHSTGAPRPRPGHKAHSNTHQHTPQRRTHKPAQAPQNPHTKAKPKRGRSGKKKKAGKHKARAGKKKPGRGAKWKGKKQTVGPGGRTTGRQGSRHHGPETTEHHGQGGAEGKKKKKKEEKIKERGGGGPEDHKTPRPKATRAGKHEMPDTERAQQEKKKGKNKNPTTTPNRATPALNGPNKPRAHQGRRQEEVRRTKTCPGGPPSPTRPRRARTRTRTHARDPGVASSVPKGAVSPSTQNSPGAPAESPVKRWMVPETGRVGDRVHTRKEPQARSPRLTPQGPARDNPIAGPRTGRTRNKPRAPAPVGASGRHKEPSSWPASVKPPGWGKAPRRPKSQPKYGERPDRTRCGAPTRRQQARQRGRPPAATKAHGQMRSNNSHRVPQTQTTRTTRKEPRHRHRCQGTPNPHTTNPSQEWRGTSGARTKTHTPQHPSQEWRGAAQNQTQARTHKQCTTQQGVAGYKRRAHTNAHTPTSQPGVVGRSRIPRPNTHAHYAHPSQEWRGTSRGRTKAHTPPITPARSNRAQPNPEPKRTHPHCTPQPGVAGYER